jgi:hypothetical protein
MEPEGSLRCSQEPAAGPYPEPDRSSLYHPILLLFLNVNTEIQRQVTSTIRHAMAQVQQRQGTIPFLCVILV